MWCTLCNSLVGKDWENYCTTIWHECIWKNYRPIFPQKIWITIILKRPIFKQWHLMLCNTWVSTWWSWQIVSFYSSHPRPYPIFSKILYLPSSLFLCHCLVSAMVRRARDARGAKIIGTLAVLFFDRFCTPYFSVSFPAGALHLTDVLLWDHAGICSNKSNRSRANRKETK